MTDTALYLEFVRQGAAGKPLEPHVFEWAREELRPPSERRATRDELLRRAAAMLPGSPWTKARRLAEMARAVRRARHPDLVDLATPAGCVAAALAAWGRDRALSVDQLYRVTCIDRVAMQVGPVRGSLAKGKNMTDYQIEAGEDARDKFIKGAAASIFQRAGLADMLRAAKRVERLADQLADLEFDPGEFRGCTLADLARESLSRQGQKVRNLHGEALVKYALEFRGSGSNTTSDYAVLLEDTARKVFLGGYGTAPVTWPRWCGRVSLRDFRPTGFFRRGSLGKLDAVTEAGEIKHKNIPDGAKATLTASTKANIVGLTRKTLVNDDLGAFTDLIPGMAEAAAFSIEDDAAALITAASGLGANAPDGVALFNAAHGNIGSTGVMSVAAWGEAAALMALQKDVSGNRVLGIAPAVVVVPVKSAMQARTLNSAAVDPAAPVSGGANAVRDMVRDVVAAPWLGATSARYYFFADPRVFPTVAVGFINGNEAPMIETSNSFNTDGIQFKVVIDYSVGILDYRPAVTCPGA